jgi:hypothetical protein
MGGYGFLRFSLPMFPLASHDFAWLIFSLSVIAIIYTSLVALMQEDIKKLIAYSSVAHMGFVTMGIFAGTLQGVAGGVFQMVSHGIVSGALFLCVGIVYDRMHTREISAYGGLVNRMPLYALVFMVFTMANVGSQHGNVGIHDADRHLQGLDPDRDVCRARCDPVGGLCALALSQGGVRQSGEAVIGKHQGPDLPRKPDAVPAGGADHPVRRLSEARARHVGGVRPATRQQL